jgi:cytidine deaminase
MTEVPMLRHLNANALNTQDQELLQAAENSQQKAYAPYSGFKVGAAVLTITGHVAMGANQENASYPLCMCGERVALYNTAIQYPQEAITALAIVVSGKKPLAAPAAPCGACLQVIREFELRQGNEPIRILLKADSEEVWEFASAQVMLPFSFDGSFLR